MRGKIHLKRLLIAVGIASYYLINIVLGIVAGVTHSAVVGVVAFVMLLTGTLGVASAILLVAIGLLLYEAIWVDWIKK